MHGKILPKRYIIFIEKVLAVPMFYASKMVCIDQVRKQLDQRMDHFLKYKSKKIIKKLIGCRLMTPQTLRLGKNGNIT